MTDPYQPKYGQMAVGRRIPADAWWPAADAKHRLGGYGASGHAELRGVLGSFAQGTDAAVSYPETPDS